MPSPAPGDDLGGELVGVAKAPLDLFAFLDRAGQAIDVDPNLELLLGLPGERPKRLNLPFVELSRHLVHDRDRPDGMAVGRDQRNPGVEADTAACADERVVLEAVVLGGVGHDERLALLDRVRAEGHRARCLRDLDTDARLEPLARLVHQAHDRHRRAAEVGSESREIVEGFLGGSVQNLVALQRFQARSLVPRLGCTHFGDFSETL